MGREDVREVLLGDWARGHLSSVPAGQGSGVCGPGNELPGYYRWSLRDRYRVSTPGFRAKAKS
jgi:hypothetical protein